MTNQPLIQAATLGHCARQYRMRPKTLMTLIDANLELKAEIAVYTEKVTVKTRKVLPPIVIGKIYRLLGDP